MSQITVTVEAPGYRSSIDMPVDQVDKAQAFCGWFKMQLDYFARWEPGATATIRETVPSRRATSDENTTDQSRPIGPDSSL